MKKLAANADVVNNLVGLVEAGAAQVAGLKARHSTDAARIANLDGEMAGLKARHSTDAARIANLDGEMACLKARHSTDAARIANLEDLRATDASSHAHYRSIDAARIASLEATDARREAGRLRQERT